MHDFRKLRYLLVSNVMIYCNLTKIYQYGKIVSASQNAFVSDLLKVFAAFDCYSTCRTVIFTYRNARVINTI